MLKEFADASRQGRIKVAVVGDCMIDEWWNVDVSRISPEAPVPVWHTTEYNPARKPGGAGNVAMQFAGWNADVTLFGLLDIAAADCYLKHGICTARCAILDQEGGLAPRKIRFMCGDVQVGRLDRERPRYGVSRRDSFANLLGQVRRCFHGDDTPDVVILSDYAKGMFESGPSFLGADCCVGLIPVIVDPKKGSMELWRGHATVIKPNEKEACVLSGVSDPQRQADWFQKTLACSGVIITHGGGGITGKEGEKYFDYAVPTANGGNGRMLTLPREVKVHSVVGAGDCFIAFLAMAVARGFSLEDAAKVAFEAGAIYVTHQYNEPVTMWELLDADNCTTNKIRSAADIPSCHVFTNGCFDILHAGHLKLLQEAKRIAGDGKLVVAINSDSSVKRLKGPSRPISTQDKRAEILAALEFVDYVTVFDEDDPRGVIKRLCPKVIVKGGDYTTDQVVGNDLAKVVIIPTVEGYSTTAIVQGRHAIELIKEPPQ